MAMNNGANSVSVQTTLPEKKGGARYDPDRHGYRIYVGNLPPDTGHDDIARTFLPFGPIVDIWLASDPPGFGFVVFKNAGDAETAVLGRNYTVFRGMIMKVQHARLFKHRFIKPFHKGRPSTPGSDTARSRSRSRSRSRPSRSRSISSSRLNKIYGGSRTKSRSPLRSKSGSRSSSMTLSVTESTSSSESGSRSRSVTRRGHSSSDGAKGQSSSNKSRYHRGHHRHRCHRSKRRRSNLRRKCRRCSRSPRKNNSSSSSSRSVSSSPRPSRSFSRSKTPSVRDHHSRKDTSTSLEGSASSKSPSSVDNDVADSQQGCRKARQKRKRRRRPKRDSSFSSSSSSSSSSSPLSPSSSSSCSSSASRQRKKDTGSKAETLVSLSRTSVPASNQKKVPESRRVPSLDPAEDRVLSAASPSNVVSLPLASATASVILPPYNGLSVASIPDPGPHSSTRGACPLTYSVIDPLTSTGDLSSRTVPIQAKSPVKITSSPLYNSCLTYARDESAALCGIGVICVSVLPSVGSVSITTSPGANQNAIVQNASVYSARTRPGQSDCVGRNVPSPTSKSIFEATFKGNIPTFCTEEDVSPSQPPGTPDSSVTKLTTGISVRRPPPSVAISEYTSMTACEGNVPDTAPGKLPSKSSTTTSTLRPSTAKKPKSQFQYDRARGSKCHTNHTVSTTGPLPADSERTRRDDRGSGNSDDGARGRAVCLSAGRMSDSSAVLHQRDFGGETSRSFPKCVVTGALVTKDLTTSVVEKADKTRRGEPSLLKGLRIQTVQGAITTEKDNLVNISGNINELAKDRKRKAPITGYDFVNNDIILEKDTVKLYALSKSKSDNENSKHKQQNIQQQKLMADTSTKNVHEKTSLPDLRNDIKMKASVNINPETRNLQAAYEKQDHPQFIPSKSHDQSKHLSQQTSEDTEVSSDEGQTSTNRWFSHSPQVPKSYTTSYENTMEQLGLGNGKQMNDYSDHKYSDFQPYDLGCEQNSPYTTSKYQKMQIMSSTISLTANDQTQPVTCDIHRQTRDPDFQNRNEEKSHHVHNIASQHNSTKKGSTTKDSLPQNVIPNRSCNENGQRNHRQFVRSPSTNYRNRNYRHCNTLKK